MKIIKNPKKNLGFYRFPPFDATLKINQNFVFASEKMYAVRGSMYAAIWNGILVDLGPFGRPLGPLWGLLARCFGACWTLLDALGRSWATLGALLEGSWRHKWSPRRPQGPAKGSPGEPQGSQGVPKESPRDPQGVPRGAQGIPKGSPRGPQGAQRGYKKSVECRRSH